jgi:hypothetical protein
VSDAGSAGDESTAGEPQVLECEPGLADCDESRLTGCETHLGWTVRYCGTCGLACDDACQEGACLASLEIGQGVLIDDFVSTTSYAFTKLSKLDNTAAFISIDVGTGKLVERLAVEAYQGFSLALSDRVYVLEENFPLRSFALDGTDLQTEDAVEPRDIGGNAGGTYYLRTVYDAEDVGTDLLYYRPSKASPWQEIRRREGRDDSRIESSTPDGIVYVEWDTSGAEQVYLLRGSDLISYGPLPANASHALAIANSVTVLTHDDAADQNELWWLKDGEEPIHYALPASEWAPTMRPFGNRVALLLEEDKTAYVQLFGEGGGFTGRVGLRLESDLAGLNEKYLFHSVTDNWIDWRVLRTPWNQFGN